MEEEIRLLLEANSQIRSLRKQNELMGARLEMFDSVMSLLNAKVRDNGQCMSPDICYEIDKFIKAKTK